MMAYAPRPRQQPERRDTDVRVLQRKTLLPSTKAGARAAQYQAFLFVVEMYSTLLPRMKASPYLALSCPFTYSSVCSIAMFMKPSRHASTPVRRLASSACAKRSRARRHATSVVHARVELDHHRPPKHLLEELSGVVLRGGRRGRSARRRHRWSLGWAEITGQRAIFLTKPRTAPLRYCTKHLQQCRQKRSACAVAVPSHRGHVALSAPTPAGRHSVTFG